MQFGEFVRNLHAYIPICSTLSDFISTLLGHYVPEEVANSIDFFRKKPETIASYASKRKFPINDAKIFLQNKDLTRFADWVDQNINNYSSEDGMVNFLISNGKEGKYLGDECADLLTVILQNRIRGDSEQKKSPPSNECLMEATTRINEILKAIPSPKEVPVPITITQSEEPYIEALLNAYANDYAYNQIPSNDTFKQKNISLQDLEKTEEYMDYKEDLDFRRTDYFAAVALKRSLLELSLSTENNHFEVLKKEVYSGVRDTALLTYDPKGHGYDNGHERMLQVMKQAALISINDYIFSNSPSWNTISIRKGVCHHLVNDKKLKWVKK